MEKEVRAVPAQRPVQRRRKEEEGREGGRERGRDGEFESWRRRLEAQGLRKLTYGGYLVLVVSETINCKLQCEFHYTKSVRCNTRFKDKTTRQQDKKTTRKE